MINDLGLQLVKEFEGLRLKAYRCPAGVWTIGYGHTRGVHNGQECTEAEAASWLVEDLLEAESTVKYLVTAPLTENQRAALVSLVFNIGGGNFRTSTLLRLLNAGDYQGAAQQFLKWTKGGGEELPGLKRRREAERALFLEGFEEVAEYPLVQYAVKRPPAKQAAYAKKLQIFLRDMGLYSGEVDGWPGECTSLGVYKLTGHYLSGDGRSGLG